MPKRLAIVGGGLSGLAAAFYLKQSLPDADVSVLEAADRLGGVIWTETIRTEEGQAFVVDLGADMFATEPPAALQLCRDLGVEDELISPDTEKAGAMIVHRGRLIRIPDGFVLMRATKLWQMVTTPLLSVPGKLRFLAERFIRAPESHQSSGVSSGPADVSDASSESDPVGPPQDQSVADFVRYRMGSEVLDRLVGPLVAGIYTADIEKLSLNATMAPIVSMVQQHGSLAKATLARRKENQDSTERNSAGARYERFRGFPRGMRQLIETLADAVGEQSIRTGCAVQSLVYDPQALQRWQVNGEAYDEVILATPAAVSARLLHGVEHPDVAAICDAAAESLAGIESASTAIVVLCVRKDRIGQLPDQFGFVVPAIENRRILAASFASHKYPIRCPEDHTIIRVFVGGATRAELLEQSDAQLVEMVREELADLIGMDGQETLSKVVRWNEAMPQYHVGHLQRVQAIEQTMRQVSGLHLATNALHGVGIAPVISSSRKLAEQIADGHE